jgi:hypothetical protein
MPTPAILTPEALTEGPAGAELLGGPSAAASRILLALLLSPDAASRLLETGTSLQPWTDPNGKSTLGLLLTTPSGLTARLKIDPATHLVTRIELAPPTDPPASDTVPGRHLGASTLAWEAGPITTDPPAPTAFEWSPPKDFMPLQEP